MSKNKINPAVHEPFRGQPQALLDYVELVYDLSSPLVFEFQDLKQRQAQARARTGVDLAAVPEEEFLEMVHYYLVYVVASNQWALLLTNQMVLNEYLEICQSPLALKDDKIGASKIKTTLLRDCNELSKAIDALHREIFREFEAESEYGFKQRRITVESQAMDMKRELKERLAAEAADALVDEEID